MKNNFLLPSQAQIKKWARLTDARFRQEAGIFPAEGVKVVEELLSSTWPTEALLVLPEKRKYWEKIITTAAETIPVYELNRTQWQKFSQDKEPEGIMALVVPKPESSLSDCLAGNSGNILILQEINNPANLGALMRSALWFGFSHIILSTNSVEHTHPKAVRASMGGLFHLQFVSNLDLKKALPEIKKFYYLIASSVCFGNAPHAPHAPHKKVALLLGSESHGLPDDLLVKADELWNIPGSGQAESLSLPQAAAIMMYESTRERITGGLRRGSRANDET